MTSGDDERLNADNFATAVTSLQEHEPMWSSQLEMMLGHPVNVKLDFDSLGGRHERIRPLVHQGLSGVLEAIGRMFLDKATWGEFLDKIRVVAIGAASDGSFRAMLNGGTLAVRVPLRVADVRAPTDQIVNALRALNGLPALPDAAPPRAHPEAMPGDAYAYATQFIADLEERMNDAGLWPGPKPAGEIVVEGAFGSGNMPFEHWLAWVFIPRVASIVETHGSFPNGSNVAGYAVRALDGANADDVIDVLRAFDDVVNRLATGAA